MVRFAFRDECANTDGAGQVASNAHTIARFITADAARAKGIFRAIVGRCTALADGARPAFATAIDVGLVSVLNSVGTAHARAIVTESSRAFVTQWPADATAKLWLIRARKTKLDDAVCVAAVIRLLIAIVARFAFVPKSIATKRNSGAGIGAAPRQLLADVWKVFTFDQACVAGNGARPKPEPGPSGTFTFHKKPSPQRTVKM